MNFADAGGIKKAQEPIMIGNAFRRLKTPAAHMGTKREVVIEEDCTAMVISVPTYMPSRPDLPRTRLSAISRGPVIRTRMLRVM